MHNRIGFIGASDAKRILDGDWLALYKEKTGEVQPENLDHLFRVQLGIWTEHFHLDWLNKYHGFDITPSAERHHHIKHPEIACLLDGWCSIRDTFVELKHTNAYHTQASLLEWYLPQIAHTCNVMGVTEGWLSAIKGNAEPEYFKVTPNATYLSELIEHELRFWWHVENKVPPELIPTASLERTVKLAAKAMIDDMRTIDMTGNNEWASLAVQFLDTQCAAVLNNKAKEQLKKLIDPDVREATGHGVAVKRNKAGSLVLSALTGEKPQAFRLEKEAAE